MKTGAAWPRIRRRDDPEGYVRRPMTRTHVSTWRRARREWLRGELPEQARVEPGHVRVDTDVGLWRAVTELPPRQRAVLVLRYYQGLSEADIASTLGVSQGTVKSQAARALADMGRLIAYDGSTVRLIDPRTGQMLERVPVRQERAVTDAFPTKCTSLFCVTGRPAGPQRGGLGPVRMRITPLTGGDSRSLPGDPVVRPYQEDSSVTSLGAFAYGDYLVWSSAGHGTQITSYLYDIRDHRVIKLGRGQADITDDGWIVVTPALGPEGDQSGASADIHMRIARLP